MKALGKMSVLLGVLLLTAALSVEAAGYTYTVKNLGYFIPTGLNSNGEVAGRANVAPTGDSHAFLYANDTLQDLGTFGGKSSTAYGINDSGQVVGQIEELDGKTYHAFLYQGGSAIDMNTLIGTNRGLTLNVAGAINNKGQIAGTCMTTTGEKHVFLYDKCIVSDWYLPGAYEVTDLNDNGQILGNYYTQTGKHHGYILDNGVLTDIAVPDGIATGVTGINSSGIVVGSVLKPDDITNAFIYQSNGDFIEFGEGRVSVASGINDGGLVVGRATTQWQSNFAYIYDDSTITDLNSLIDPSLGFTGASYINNKGQICAGNILLTPIPEPSTLLLSFLGLLGFFVFING